MIIIACVASALALAGLVTFGVRRYRTGRRVGR
jgi:hypothetical protein